MSTKRKKSGQKPVNRKTVQAKLFCPMTVQKREAVKDWLSEMKNFADRAISLAGKLDSGNLRKEDDLFWALVKYAENVQESIKQLDDLNGSILPALEEIPAEPKEGADMSWKGFKRMRDILAHQFRNIDPGILWAVVTQEFPVLKQLLDVLVVGEGVLEKGNNFKISFNVGVFLDLPAFNSEELLSPGNSIICLFFDEKGKARCWRFSRINDGSFRIDPTEEYDGLKMTVNLAGEGEPEDLGHWQNFRLSPMVKEPLI